MVLPNTIIPGAQKSGTTALCRFLAAHPQVRVSEPKEPNFFSRADNLPRLARYERCFGRAEPIHRIFVDGTTSYMADASVAPRIRQLLGKDVKFVFVLRSPAARTYSSYLHMLKRGHERRSADEVFLSLPDDIESARDAERAAIDVAAAGGMVVSRPYRRLYDDVLWNYRYVGNSCYSTLAQSYFTTFDRERILILFFEEMTRNISVARAALGAFLEIDPDLFPDVITRDNPTRIPEVSTSWGWLLEQARWIKRRNFRLVNPSEITASPRQPSAAVREKLARLLASEVAYWSRYSGRDLTAIGW